MKKTLAIMLLVFIMLGSVVGQPPMPGEADTETDAETPPTPTDQENQTNSETNQENQSGGVLTGIVNLVTSIF